jgi:hypothetical protein
VDWKLNDLDSLVVMPKRFHRKTHTNAYYQAINNLMELYDQNKGGTLLRDLKKLLRIGTPL